LFAYTCGFSVVAALGQATQVASVDTSKTVLSWGKKNFELNHLDTNKHKFYLRDSIEYLDYCIKKNIQYDLIICDPPSFSRGESGVFKIETALEDLLKKSLQCLTDKGTLLFSTNFEKFYIDDIRKSILNVQKFLKIKDLEISSIQSALDFELVGQAPILKSFLIRLTDI
jgi:23S rRNA G2069 N7-methylase RlmK/C1962 C5-methylase RlmI